MPQIDPSALLMACINIVIVIVWAIRFEGSVKTRLEVVHERKAAMVRRIDALEADVKDLRSEIRQMLKDGFTEIKAELHDLRQHLDRKADKA